MDLAYHFEKCVGCMFMGCALRSLLIEIYFISFNIV